MLEYKIKKTIARYKISHLHSSSLGTAHTGLCFFREGKQGEWGWQQDREVVAWQMKQKNTS